MELFNNLEKRINYSDFLQILDVGDWEICKGINDNWDMVRHLDYIKQISTFPHPLFEFIPDDNIPKLVETIDVYLKPDIRESEETSRIKHIQFKKIK